MSNIFLLSLVKLSSYRYSFFNNRVIGLLGGGVGIGIPIALEMEELHVDFLCSWRVFFLAFKCQIGPNENLLYQPYINF